MAFADEVFAVFDKYNVPLHPHLALQLSQLAPAAPAVSAQPQDDKNGFFALMGVTNPKYANALHQVKELTNALPAGSFDRACAELNLAQANGEWKIAQFIGVGVEVEEYHNDVTGGTDYRIVQPVKNIPNTFSWPEAVVNGFDLSKVSGVVAYVNQLG